MQTWLIVNESRTELAQTTNVVITDYRHIRTSIVLSPCPSSDVELDLLTSQFLDQYRPK